MRASEVYVLKIDLGLNKELLTGFVSFEIVFAYLFRHLPRSHAIDSMEIGLLLTMLATAVGSALLIPGGP
jgi:hypothetical protein